MGQRRIDHAENRRRRVGRGAGIADRRELHADLLGFLDPAEDAGMLGKRLLGVEDERQRGPVVGGRGGGIAFADLVALHLLDQPDQRFEPLRHGLVAAADGFEPVSHIVERHLAERRLGLTGRGRIDRRRFEPLEDVEDHVIGKDAGERQAALDDLHRRPHARRTEEPLGIGIVEQRIGKPRGVGPGAVGFHRHHPVRERIEPRLFRIEGAERQRPVLGDGRRATSPSAPGPCRCRSRQAPPPPAAPPAGGSR